MFLGDPEGEVEKNGMENRDQGSWGGRAQHLGAEEGVKAVPRKEGGWGKGSLSEWAGPLEEEESQSESSEPVGLDSCL